MFSRFSQENRSKTTFGRPLARIEIGQDQIQGVDYLYNLQGWLKGVNASNLDESHDPGKDALNSQGNPNQHFAKDVYSFGLHYYNGDYAPIGSLGTSPTITNLPIASIDANSHAAQNATTNDLYNGNIRFMQTSLTEPTTRDAMPMLNTYQYDQLNRLLASRSYETGFSNNSWNPTGYNSEYFNKFVYDANGNILTQQRHSRNGDLWEDLSYHYRYADQANEEGLIRNRLYHVNDAVGVVDPNGSDLDDQGVFEGDPNLIETDNNYVRDEQGRLISNSIEEIELINWTVSGKVKEIIRETSSTKKNISFDFDAMGNQIAKHIYNNQTGLLEKSTYYILDAQGHQLSIYEHIVDTSSVQYNLAERQIYGSSHIGKTTLTVDMYDETVTNSSTTTTLGYKRFSLSDHRGNVNTVISDIKFPVEDNGNVAYFEAQIINIADYSPFNVELDGRTIKNDFYRYSVQGQERHDEINGEGNYINYKYRGYDPRIGRLDWMMDPLADDYPDYSPYQFSGNKVIHAIELEGLEEFILIKRADTDGFYLFWDITARERQEAGTIIVLSSEGTVIEDIRPLNDREKDHAYIKKRVNMKTPLLNLGVSLKVNLQLSMKEILSTLKMMLNT